MVAAVIILAAVLVGLFRVAANMMPRYHDEIEQMVVTQLGAKVALGRISLVWRGLGPALLVRDVTVRDPESGQVVIAAGALRLDFSPWAIFHGINARPTAFRLLKPQLLLKQLPDGSLVVPGLKFRQSAGPSPLKYMLGDAVSVDDGRVRIELAGTDHAVWTVQNIQLDIGLGLTHRLHFAALLPAQLGRGKLQLRGEVHTPDNTLSHWNWRASFSLDRLRLGPLNRFVPAQAPRLTGTVAAQGRLTGSGAVLKTAEGQFRGDDITAGGSRIARLGSDFRFESDAQAMQLTLGEPRVTFSRRTWEPGRMSAARDKSGRLHFAIRNVQLDVVPSLVGFLPTTQAALGRRLVAMQPRGSVRNLRFALTPGKTDFDMSGTLHDVSLAHVRNTPGAEHVSGSVDIHRGVGVAHLDAPGLTLLLPNLFGHPVALDNARGDILVSLTDQGLRLGLPRLNLAGPALSGALKGVIDVPREGPVHVRLVARANGTDVTTARTRYLPHGLLPKPLDTWLMSSFSGGRITGATLSFDGPVDTFPYEHGGGYFGVDFGYTDVTLSPGWGWTPLKDLGGRVRFENAGMQATITQGNISGAHVEKASAAIQSFFKLHLIVKADVAGDADNFLNFLRTSPISKQLGGAFARVHARGPTRTRLALDIPIMHPNRFALSGKLSMNGVDANFTGLPFTLKDLKGSEAYDARGPLSGTFTGRLGGSPVTLRVGRSGTDNTVRTTLAGALPATLLANFLPSGVGAYFSGHMPLRLAFSVSMNRQGPPPTIDADSNLKGLAIRLPAPLGKPATAAVPLTAHIEVHGPRMAVTARYGSVLSGCADIDVNANVPDVSGLRLVLGSTGCESPMEGLAFSGRWPRLTLDPWLKLISKADFSAAGGNVQNRLDGLRLDLHFGELKLFGQTLHDQTVTGALGRDRMLLNFKGEDLLGKVDIPRHPDNADPIVVEVKHARFALARKPVVPPTTASSPAPATMVRAASVAGLARPPATTGAAGVQTLPAGATVITAAASTGSSSAATGNGLRPQDFPPLVLHADHIGLGAASFDNVLVRVNRLPSGIEFKPLRVGGGSLDFDGILVWIKPEGRAGHGQGSLKFLSHVHSLGDLLEGIGLGPVITGHGAASAGLAWSEQASQGARLTHQLLGKVSIDLRDGQISKVSPGAGRLLTLLNLANIPRYLTFNFNNLTGKGFPFSRIHGDYAIDKGVASTQGLFIDSSVADIKLTGDMDLDSQTLNQRARIEPNYTGSLPIIGALVGGLGVGAAIFAVTKILGGAIAQASQLNYSITGPFSNPVVKPVGNTPSPAPASRARPAAAGGANP